MGRDGSHLPYPPVPGLDSARRPRSAPHGPWTLQRKAGSALQRPGLAALHLRRPVKHVTQIRTTSFLRYQHSIRPPRRPRRLSPPGCELAWPTMSRGPRLSLRLTALAIALATLAAVAGGCGSDTEQVDAEELIKRGDEICAEGRKRFDQVQAQAPANAAERRRADGRAGRRSPRRSSTSCGTSGRRTSSASATTATWRRGAGRWTCWSRDGTRPRTGRRRLRARPRRRPPPSSPSG